jgi:hypothetical protein
MISPDELRQDNVDLQSATTQFNRLYQPLGPRYLRGLDSYMYNRNKAPISTAERLIKHGIAPLGTKPNNVNINVPASASREQKLEYLYRQDALRNRRVDDGARFQPYNSGLSTGGVNRDMTEKLGIGMVYTTSKRDSKRVQNLIPPIY